MTDKTNPDKLEDLLKQDKEILTDEEFKKLIAEMRRLMLLTVENNKDTGDSKWERFDKNMDYLKQLDRTQWKVTYKDQQ